MWWDRIGGGEGYPGKGWSDGVKGRHVYVMEKGELFLCCCCWWWWYASTLCASVVLCASDFASPLCFHWSGSRVGSPIWGSRPTLGNILENTDLEASRGVTWENFGGILDWLHHSQVPRPSCDWGTWLVTPPQALQGTPAHPRILSFFLVLFLCAFFF